MATVDPQIKYEFDQEDMKKCRTCLSVDRKLCPLGQLSIFYQKFLKPYQYNDMLHENMLLCWECCAILRRFVQFQNKVDSAESSLLNAYKRRTELQKSLSTLSTRIITDDNARIIYYKEETNLTPTTKIENKSEDDFEIANDADINFISLDTNFNLKDEAEIKGASIELDRKKNYWVKKRAQLNKKPKFNIVQATNEEKKDRYKKVAIDYSELSRWLDEERKSCFFQDKQFKCDKCILGFNNEKSLLRHNSACHGKDIGRFTCDICQTRLPRKSRLVTHCRNHYYKYVCTLCQYSCYKRHNQYYHQQYSHQKMYQCLQCLINFWSRKEFYAHYKDLHENFVCDYCGVRFKMKYCIKKHIRKKHCPLECSSCNRKFARYNSLWLHNKLKHPTKKLEQAYCVECNKYFDNIYSYKWHLNNSVRHKPKKKLSIPCPGCDKVFSKNIYMKDHFDLVHLKKFKYRCVECDKNFVRNADLVKHTRRVHEGIQVPKDKICYVCGRGFSSNKILNNHIRTHTGERPFQCEFCPAKFAQKVAMTGHMRNIHFKEKKIETGDNLISYY